MPRLALLFAAVALTACSSGGAPEPTPTPTPPRTTPTATIQPTPTRTGPLTTGLGVAPGEQPPRLPLMTDRSANGAYSVGSFFLRALDWSTRTTDAYLLRMISDPSCAGCVRTIRRLDELQRIGSRLEGGRITENSFKTVTGTFKITSDHVYEASVDEAAIVVVTSAGARSTSAPSIHADNSLIFVSWVGSAWKVVGWGAPS